MVDEFETADAVLVDPEASLEAKIEAIRALDKLVGVPEREVTERDVEVYLEATRNFKR